MYYDRLSDGGVEIRFKDLEVETVRAAYEEHNDRLRSLGNDSSVSPYQERVARWQGTERSFRGANDSQLTAKLEYFAETTEERVDDILEERGIPGGLGESARRYELGENAARLLESIRIHASMEAEWSEVLGDEA